MQQNQVEPTSDMSVLLKGNFSDSPGHSLIFSALQTPPVIPSESLLRPSQSPVQNSNILVGLDFSVQLSIFHSLYLLLRAALLPLSLHQSQPLLQTGSLELQFLYILFEGPQAVPQSRHLLPALSQSFLSYLLSLEQGHEQRLIPALQHPHAATETLLQPDRSPATQANITYCSGSGKSGGLFLQGI